MTDQEFDILDELYFVTSYADLRRQLSLPDAALCASLQELLAKGYIKILYPDQDTEHEYEETLFQSNCLNYFFLATKAGLVVHNTR